MSSVLRTPKPIKPSSLPSHSYADTHRAGQTWKFAPLKDEEIQLGFMAEVEKELRERKGFHSAKSWPSFFEEERPRNGMVDDPKFEEI